MSALDRYLRGRHERFHLLKNWRTIVSAVVKAARAAVPDSRVFVFGSAVRGDITADSDLDILVASPGLKMSERHRVACEIEEALETRFGIGTGLVELHIVPESLLPWYKRHAEELVEAETLAQQPGPE